MVTIVVLLILAGVTITMVLGEDGIIAQAKLAAERVKEEEEKEQTDLNKLVGDIQNWVNGGTSGSSSSGEITPPTEPTPEEPSPTPETPTPPTLDEAKAQSTPFEQTTEVTVGKDTMTVPGGFRVKEGNSIKEGIVITDSAGNEFVWVPVPEINDMVWCKDHAGSTITFNKKTEEFSCSGNSDGEHKPNNTQLVGKLYNFNSSKQTAYDQSKVIAWSERSYHEPDILSSSSYDTTEQLESAGFTTDLNTSGKVDKEDFKIELQNEFYNMAKSVGKYGGFYIGRYETSISGEKTASKANVKSAPEQNWWVQYKCNKAYAEKNGNLAVVSSTIWGCQYDAMMNWMVSNKIDVASPTPTADVEKNGDSTGRITGASGSKDKLCNIYDLLGNSHEWTMEAFDASTRVYRGDNYYGSNSPSYREVQFRSYLWHW